MDSRRKLEIGHNIKRLRQGAGIKQRELAAMLGKDPSAISKYESGEIAPRIGVVEQMAAIFHVEKSAILDSAAPEQDDPKRRRLLELWDAMDARDRDVLLTLAEKLAGDAQNPALGRDSEVTA